jgi:UDP-N-acetylglucosamine 4,6-dehydratase
MRVADLAQAIAPGCEMDVTGIRAGEKLHELLVSEDEARNTLEFDDMYLLQPLFAWWSGGRWHDGRKLPDGFRYSSENNTQWLSADELRRMADEI